MALTLAEAAKLSNDILLAGVIETVVKESPVLQALPFIEIVGNGLTYNRENAAATASFFDVGDTWTEDTPTFTQQTATLKILGGDADIDNFLIATRNNVQDLQAAIVQLKAKAVQQKFDDTFINGDLAGDPKSFDGIDKLTTGGQTISMGTNGATLTLTRLDELVDLIKAGKPDMLLMSKRTRRTLNGLGRSSGTFLETDRNEFGQMTQFTCPSDRAGGGGICVNARGPPGSQRGPRFERRACPPRPPPGQPLSARPQWRAAPRLEDDAGPEAEVLRADCQGPEPNDRSQGARRGPHHSLLPEEHRPRFRRGVA